MDWVKGSRADKEFGEDYGYDEVFVLKHGLVKVFLFMKGKRSMVSMTSRSAAIQFQFKAFRFKNTGESDAKLVAARKVGWFLRTQVESLYETLQDFAVGDGQ